METFFVFSVSCCIFAPEIKPIPMREHIMKRAMEDFLQYGFKSFTMDNLSRDLGMSKKTLYGYYSSKTELIEACVEKILILLDHRFCFPNDETGIIENIFSMQKDFIEKYKITTNRPIWELKKYYPNIHQKLYNRFKEKDDEFVEIIINRGIKEGVFRENVELDFVKSFYSGIHKMNEDPDLFPETRFSVYQVLKTQLEFFVRILANEKGIKELEFVLKNIT